MSARLAAKLIDQLVVLPLVLVALYLSFVALGFQAASVPRTAAALRGWSALSAASKGAGLLAAGAWGAPFLLGLYQWFLLATRGQTLGKRLCSIRIVDLAGRPAGFFRAVLLREWLFGLVLGLAGALLSLLVPPAALLLMVLDPAFIFTEGRQTLHDHFARTQVRWVKDYEQGRLRLAWGLVAAGTVAVVALGALAYQAREGLARELAKAQPLSDYVSSSSGPALKPSPGAAPVKGKPGVFYRYVDSNGVVTVVDDFAKIPERYRSSAEEMK